MRFQLCAALLFVGQLASAQFPADRKLSPEDNRGFQRELRRLRTVLATANDRGTVRYQIARTYAAGGQYFEATRLLREIVVDDLGFDPSRDPDFADLRDTAEFRSILETSRRQTPPVSKSRAIATVENKDLFPENLAVRGAGDTFFLGSTVRGGIFRCPRAAVCAPLVVPRQDDRVYVLGLKMDTAAHAIWAATNLADGASLCRYDIQTGALQRSAHLEGKHVFNDLAVTRAGTVYVTDTAGSAVYRLDTGTDVLQRIAPEHPFPGANGITLSPDETLLYVSAWGDGIAVINLQSGSVAPLSHPERVCLASIDGLYATATSLVAIQNGPMVPRIVRFKLSRTGREIVGMEVLERRNPLFDGLTTGALVNGLFFYIANPQLDRKGSANLQPLRILAVAVGL